MPETYRETSASAEAILGRSRPLATGGTIGLVDYMGGDARIVAAATLNQGPGIAGVSSEEDLLVSLAHNGIWDPFQFAEIELRVETDLAGTQHLVYHPEVQANQRSARYSKFKERVSDLTALGASEDVQAAHSNAAHELFETYRSLLGTSLAKETARGVMPDTTYTSFFLKMNLAQLFTVTERLERGSWKNDRERHELADTLLDVASQVAPLAVQAYLERREGETKDLIDWELVARNAPRAVMADPAYPNVEQRETQRATVDELESLLFRPLQPIAGGLLLFTDYMGDFRRIANAARVSYTNQKSASEDEALIRTLLQNKHSSPFEQGELGFFVRWPGYIERQGGRHRTLDTAGFMGETAIAQERYVPRRSDLAPQSKASHQGRAGGFDDEAAGAILGLYGRSNDIISGLSGIVDDPSLRDRLGPTDRWIGESKKTDPWNLLHFLTLRADSHAQLEIQQYARMIGVVMRSWLPPVMDAYDRFIAGAITLDRDELDAIHEAGSDAGIEGIIAKAAEKGIFDTTNESRRQMKIDAMRSKLHQIF